MNTAHENKALSLLLPVARFLNRDKIPAGGLQNLVGQTLLSIDHKKNLVSITTGDESVMLATFNMPWIYSGISHAGDISRIINSTITDISIEPRTQFSENSGLSVVTVLEIETKKGSVAFYITSSLNEQITRESALNLLA